MASAFIYLLQDGQHIGTNIYKIGKTVQKGGDARTLNRLYGFSHGTIPYGLWVVPEDSIKDIKKHIIQKFKTKYTLAQGNEWFKGNWLKMKTDIDEICYTYQSRSHIT